MFAVVLTGPPGAGKSSVLMALSDALSDDDVRHATVEVEALVWTHPALTETKWRQNVETMCKLHREAGHELLLVAETLETDADLVRLLNAVGAHDRFLVRLEAEPATLAARIKEREPPGWSGLSQLVSHAQYLAESMPALSGVDLVVCTEGARPEDAAARIRGACPGRLSHGGC